MNPYAICLSLYGSTEEIINDIRHNDADLYEIRVDLSAGPDAAAIRKATTRPLIFTAHGKPELLETFAAHADFLDAGLSILPTGAFRHIISYHGEDDYPPDFLNTAGPSKLLKIALNTAKYSNIFHLIELNRHGNVMAFAMGECGSFSRLLSVFNGASWIYASLPGRQTGEGQFSFDELLDLYRLRRFSSPPLVFGIIGNPVSHSKSPLYHNARFAEEEKPWIYLPFLCNDLQSLMQFAPRFGMRGFSITHPFKENVIPLLTRCSNEVRALNACNTVFYGNDSWEGINTDVAGAQAILNEIRIPLERQRVLLLGAGGAAKAMAFALHGKVKELIVLNRTVSKAEGIANACDGKCGSLNDFGKFDYDVLIQATSIGMRNEESPIPLEALKEGAEKIVIDLIYNPAETALLKRAAEIGCRTLNGNVWFDAQAEAQFRWWKEKEGEKRQP